MLQNILLILMIIIIIWLIYILFKHFWGDKGQGQVETTHREHGRAQEDSTATSAKAANESGQSTSSSGERAEREPQETKAPKAASGTAKASTDMAASETASSKVSATHGEASNKGSASGRGGSESKAADAAAPMTRLASVPEQGGDSTAKADGGMATSGVPDDLTRIKGVGKVIEGKLHDHGITRFAQIAAWSDTDVAEFNKKLAFSGRIEREEWITQAKELAKS